MYRILGSLSCTLLGVAALTATAAGQPPAPLWTPRYLASGEIPLPDRIAQANLVVLGRVVALEDKTVATKPFSGSSDKVAYRVAVIKVGEMLRGDKAVIEVNLGFIPPESYKRDLVGVPTPAVPLPQTATFKVGQEGIFFLKKHHQENFYVNFALSGGFLPVEALKPGKSLEDVRKLTNILNFPVNALKDMNTANRFLAAAMLIRSYRPSAVKGQERQEEPIDAEVSKLLLKTLAQADWKYDSDRLIGTIYPAHPYTLFLQLGVTKADGYEPNLKASDIRETLDTAQRWLQENQQKYRIKRFVPKAM